MTFNFANSIEPFVSGLAAWAANALPNILAAILIILIGLAVARWAGRATRRHIEASPSIDNTVAASAGTLVRYGVTIIVLVAALGQLGFQTTSLLAALGAAGLAIGLALKDTLANIAAGFMLLWLQPFRVGDYIEGGGVAGTVRQVGLFASELETYDGLYEFVPNSALWNTQITNHSRLPQRMVELTFGVGYDDDLSAGQDVLNNIARADRRVLQDPAPNVFVDTLGDSAVNLTLRAWTTTDDYWPARRALTQRGKIELERAGLSIPYPQLDVHGVEPGGSAHRHAPVN